MTATVAACGSCGNGLRDGAKFCDECGVPVADSAETAKYKQVTVLFADVVRSTDIAAAVDLERLREIMTELLEGSAAVVRRYGGTVVYNGDGVMALFGAPVALEDHAFRGCLAALAIQDEATRLAEDVRRRDGVGLQLRVGLNSGQVIAGEIGSGTLGYAATGATVGFAQRMESTAPPGGVLLSEATARLVEQTVSMSERTWVRVKGADDLVAAYRLLAVNPRSGFVGRAETALVGRRWEMAVLDAIVERAIGGRGGIVNVVGPPGIGKSRVAREAAALASRRGVEVFWAFCESHARDVPFHAVTELLRASVGVADLEGEAARTRMRVTLPGEAEPDDLLLAADLLGIADAEVPLPQINPDARRRRLTALINTAALARTAPALFVIEDAHWIDAVSESLLVDLLTVVARTPAMVLITSRPDYQGALTRLRGAQAIALAPLADSATLTLLGELLGQDPSIRDLTTVIADRADGNPFFAEEMVRELVQRGVLIGERGSYECPTGTGEVRVPATVQAAIEARVDRLSAAAKAMLHAASVIGVRFGPDLLAAQGIDPDFDELLNAELIDQVRFTPQAEYAFRHPLIRAVAYETQLKSDRADIHRRLAESIQARDPATVEENAALIAEHLEAAGDVHAAYGWHMRAAAWSADREVNAARLSWERACRIADALPDADPDRLSMRIAPRTMLCVTDWLARKGGRNRFAELRELCEAAGDKVSLAVGMSGLASELLYAERPGEGSRLASEQMALLESIGDPTFTVGLAFTAFANWFNSGDFDKIAELSETVIEQADGDPSIGAGFGLGSPLAVALAFRGVARWWLGRPGWRQDVGAAITMGRDSDATTYALVLAWTYGLAIGHGVLCADDSTLGMAEEAVHLTQRGSSDFAVCGSLLTLGFLLLYRDSRADRDRGLELMAEARDVSLPQQAPSLVPVAAIWVAREKAQRGHREAVLPEMRQAVDQLHREGRRGWEVLGTSALVETLLDGGTTHELTEARALTDRLANQSVVADDAMLEITLLRLRALLAHAEGDVITYRDLASRYRAMAKSLDFEGHFAWAEAMVG